MSGVLRCVPQLVQARVQLFVRRGLTKRDRRRDMTISQALQIAGWLCDPSLTTAVTAA